MRRLTLASREINVMSPFGGFGDSGDIADSNVEFRSLAVFVLFAVMHVQWLVPYFAPAILYWVAELTQRRRQQLVLAEITPLSATLLRVRLPPFPEAARTSLHSASGCPNAHVYIARAEHWGPLAAHPFSVLHL